MTETYARSIVAVRVREFDPDEDLVVHTVWHHHSDEGGSLGPFDPGGHATNVMNAFLHGTGAGTHQWNLYASRQIHVKVYNMSQMKPRPILGEALHTPTSYSSAALAPRETASVLRYFATRNLVGQRGRMYMGPYEDALMNETVTNAMALTMFDLATALAAIGGANTSWCMHSEKQDLLNAPGSPGGTTPAAYHDITEVWVNDRWAHMESREHAEAARWTQAITPGLP